MARLTVAVAAAALALGGCASAAPTAQEALLDEYGLAGLPATQIIDQLDRLGGTDRPADLMASVRVDELLLSDDTSEVALDLPDDRFYLSIAPYVSQTHECFYHSLTTCQGELTGEDVQVKVVDGETGDVLVDEQMETFENGFIGLWLPRDIEGAIEVSSDGRTGEVPFATGDEDATCLTTLQLA